MHNDLLLNATKSELLLVGTKHQTKSVSSLSVDVCDAKVSGKTISNCWM